jgi:hypothetical protein
MNSGISVGVARQSLPQTDDDGEKFKELIDVLGQIGRIESQPTIIWDGYPVSGAARE